MKKSRCLKLLIQRAVIEPCPACHRERALGPAIWQDNGRMIFVRCIACRAVFAVSFTGKPGNTRRARIESWAWPEFPSDVPVLPREPGTPTLRVVGAEVKP